MLDSIPQNRMILYILLLGVVPLFAAVFEFMNQKQYIEDIERSVLIVQQQAATREKKQAVNRAVQNNFRDSDHFYIDKYLETLDLLEPEIEALQKVHSNKNYPDDENIKKRLEFLTGPGNNLIFTEGAVQSTPTFQEVIETMVHPVEVNVKDIGNILARIEGTKIGDAVPGPNRPQLIILDFRLEKKHLSNKNEVFMLNVKLLKREFL